MSFDPEQVRAAYYVSGVTTYGGLHEDLDAALEAADVINQQPGNVDDNGFGRAFIVPVMAIRYPPPPSEQPPV
ncbi:hypothetical protein ACIQPP_05650 [Streptomyces violaceusniger]|uniref:hypothetical protein n=1 Tax=Streptomyces violaceusniger TaxID=68280 RepID=UPI00099703A3|nr:hypothetical protein [Streptomyces hygroscopicus]AQW55305.1 hypothetical protein SHXM_08768 [Streptomyces hygroscopicus]